MGEGGGYLYAKCEQQLPCAAALLILKNTKSK